MAIRGSISKEHTRLIFVEMLRRVGLSEEDHDAFDFTEDKWYEKHTWTLAEQEDFRTWLGKFLEDHKYVTKRKYRNQDWGRYEAAKFILDYGWRVTDWEKYTVIPAEVEQALDAATPAEDVVPPASELKRRGESS